MNSIRSASFLLVLVSVVYSQTQNATSFCGVTGSSPRSIGNYCDSSRSGYYQCSGTSSRFIQCPAATHCGCFSLNCKDVPLIGDHAPCVRQVNVPAIPTDFTAVTLGTESSGYTVTRFIYGSANSVKTYVNPNTANETNFFAVATPGQGYNTYAQIFNRAGGLDCLRTSEPTGDIATVAANQFDFASQQGLRSSYEFFGRNTTSGFDTYYLIDMFNNVYKYSVTLTNPAVPVSASVTAPNGVFQRIDVQSFNIGAAPASVFVAAPVCN